MKKRKKVVFLITTLIILWLSIPFFISVWIKTSTDRRVNLSFFLTPFGARVLNFYWKIMEKPLFTIKTNGSINVPWRSLFFSSDQLLAFQMPATMKLPSGKTKMNFSGEIQGNFKKGEVNLKDVNIWLEKFGKIFVSGKLVQWGTEFCEVQGNIKDFAIDELRNILGIQNLPFSASITGKLSITINREIVKLLKFDIDFSNLLLQQQSSPLSGHVRGAYDIIEKKCTIDSGDFLTQSGGKISVKGMISREEFSLKIESEGVNLEEIISQLPQKWQEKFKIEKNSRISINAESSRKKGTGLPYFAGFLSIPDKIQFSGFSCYDLTIQNSAEKNEILLKAKRVEIGKIGCDEISGEILRENERYKGNLHFSFYNGLGEIQFVTSESSPFKVFAKTEISKIDIAKLVQALNPDILITGLLNVICFLEFGDKDFSIMAKIDNVPGRLFSQKLNFSAVKALASLGSSGFAGSVGKRFGSNNFYYRKLSGVISIINGYLTIEGTAKRAGQNDYLLTSEIFGSGINVLVDRNNNSIQIEDLKQRIGRAMKQNKAQFKLSLSQQGGGYGDFWSYRGKQVMFS